MRSKPLRSAAAALTRFGHVVPLSFVYSRLVVAKIAESSFRLKTCRRMLSTKGKSFILASDMVLHIDFGFVSGGKIIGLDSIGQTITRM